MNNNNYYFDVTYRKEGSNIYQSLIVQASRAELAEQYVKEKGGIIADAVAKANIDEDKRKGKPVVTIQADRLLTRPYIETLLKEERLWKEGEADTFQYKDWVITLTKTFEHYPFFYEIEATKIGTDKSVCRPFANMAKAMLYIVNDFEYKENINILDYIYPVGTRIELAYMDDPQAIPTGTRGTVDHIDDAGQIHMKWDNGRSLAVIFGVDDFRLLTDDEIKAEKEQIKTEPDITDDYDY